MVAGSIASRSILDIKVVITTNPGMVVMVASGFAQQNKGFTETNSQAAKKPWLGFIGFRVCS